MRPADVGGPRSIERSAQILSGFQEVFRVVTRRQFVVGGCVLLGGGLVALRPGAAPSVAGTAAPPRSRPHGEWRDVTDDEWRELLTSEQYRVLRESGTESPFTSALLDEHRAGVFSCAGCDLGLFSSTTKFDSGTGWPSFWKPLPNAVATRNDNSLGMVRTEVHCRRCGGHLGHLFDDGPKPTGLRYCMNGLSMEFKPL